MREELQRKEDDADGLRRRTRILESGAEAKFHSEKEKIVAILEAGFAQRERLAVRAREEELEARHGDERARAAAEAEAGAAERLAACRRAMEDEAGGDRARLEADCEKREAEALHEQGRTGFACGSLEVAGGTRGAVVSPMGAA